MALRAGPNYRCGLGDYGYRSSACVDRSCDGRRSPFHPSCPKGRARHWGLQGGKNLRNSFDCLPLTSSCVPQIFINRKIRPLGYIVFEMNFRALASRRRDSHDVTVGCIVPEKGRIASVPRSSVLLPPTGHSPMAKYNPAHYFSLWLCPPPLLGRTTMFIPARTRL